MDTGETYEQMMARHARQQRERDAAWEEYFHYHRTLLGELDDQPPQGEEFEHE